MQTITINASSRYNIYVGDDILKMSGELISKLSTSKKAVIVTDDIVDKLYSKTLINSLEISGFTVFKFVFENGEPSKCHSTLIGLYEFLVENQITRSDMLIALGGGVVGDLTGFAAATYLRGINFVQIPTTLLAQTDASIGGKTAVDIKSGKNLVGAFKQPLCIITDTKLLKSLPADIFSDGMSEIIKYGMIKSESLFNKLLSEDINKNLHDVIIECINIKKDAVESDEFDKGQRMLLNFGHTLGHSIEKYYNFSGITHGKAVAIGMCEISEISERKGITQKGVTEKLKQCLVKYGLPVSTKVPLNERIDICMSDKKRENDSINIIICKNIGESYIDKLSVKDFYKFMGESNV